jgi:hypothetical protein
LLLLSKDTRRILIIFSRRFPVMLLPTVLLLAEGSASIFPHRISAKERDPLTKLGLTQIGDVNRLVEFGCRDLLKIAAVVRPVTETPSVGGYLRGYEYKGIAFSTLVGQREVIQGAVARASALKEWGILAQESASLADVIHKFGKPSRAEGDVYWYGSDQYQTAIVFIRLTAKKVSQIDWSCG